MNRRDWIGKSIAVVMLAAPVAVGAVVICCTRAAPEAGDAHCERFYEDDRVVAYKTWIDGYNSSKQVRLVEKDRR